MIAKYHYCPFCQRNVEPFTDEDTGEILTLPDGGVVYIHDEVPHDPDYKFEELQ